VSETSLAHDRLRKLPLDARRGVVEVWIVNPWADAIDVARGPSRGGYREQFRRGRGEEIAPAAFPDLRLSVDDVLGRPRPRPHHPRRRR
jgi:Uma2 family endonuclease